MRWIWKHGTLIRSGGTVIGTSSKGFCSLLIQGSTVPSHYTLGSSGWTNTSALITDCSTNCSLANTTTYYHEDQINSSRLISDGFGYSIWQATFLPYGEEYGLQIGANHYKFADDETDSESQLDHFGARYYESALGRFVSGDPVFLDPDRVAAPQRLNLYSYAADNPMRFVDPTGKAPIDAGLLARVNDVTGAVHNATLAAIASYRRDEPGFYSPEGLRLTGHAAATQQHLEEHFNDPSDSWALIQYDGAFTALEEFLAPGVEKGIMDSLSQWANDPSTSEEDLKAAIGDIAVVQMGLTVEPNEGNQRLKEMAKSAAEKAIDEWTDHFSEHFSIWKKIAEFTNELLDSNRDFRSRAMATILGAAYNKKRSGGQKCQITQNNGKTWESCHD